MITLFFCVATEEYKTPSEQARTEAAARNERLRAKGKAGQSLGGYSPKDYDIEKFTNLTKPRTTPADPIPLGIEEALRKSRIPKPGEIATDTVEAEAAKMKEAHYAHEARKKEEKEAQRTAKWLAEYRRKQALQPSQEEAEEEVIGFTRSKTINDFDQYENEESIPSPILPQSEKEGDSEFSRQPNIDESEKFGEERMPSPILHEEEEESDVFGRQPNIEETTSERRPLGVLNPNLSGSGRYGAFNRPTTLYNKKAID